MSTRGHVGARTWRSILMKTAFFTLCITLMLSALAFAKTKEGERSYDKPFEKVWAAILVTAPQMGRPMVTDKESGTMVLDVGGEADKVEATLTIQAKQKSNIVVVHAATKRTVLLGRTVDVSKFFKRLDEEIARAK
jgi:hypothetical protein